MSDIIKTFKFESEGVQLFLHIKKEVHNINIGARMYIYGDIASVNSELKVNKTKDGLTENTFLTYQDNTVFWISYNEYKGLRWKSYNNKTGFSVYQSVKEMKEKYIEQCDLIPAIGDYFMESIKVVKKAMMLYETPLSDIISDEE